MCGVVGVVLRDPDSGRTLVRGMADDAGPARLSFGNCGHQALLLEVRSVRGGGPFTADVVRP